MLGTLKKKINGTWVEIYLKTKVSQITDFYNATMNGATTSAAGSAGLVPAPAAGDQGTKYLRADGTWAVPNVGALPTASATVLGCVKVGSGLAITNGVLSSNITKTSQLTNDSSFITSTQIWVE